MKIEKIDPKIKQNLFSSKNEIVISAINEIKNRGNSLYLPILFELLKTNTDKEVEEEIVNLLGTVKEKESVNSFMRAIEDEKFKTIRKQLLTACWQNGLDFSTFLPVFVDQIINEDWEIAFEAFTIVDNLETLPSEGIVNVAIEKIRNAMNNVNEQKQYFLHEILVKLNA